MALPNSQSTEHPIGGGQSPTYVAGPGGMLGFFQDPYGAVFTGTISGTTLTVISLLQGSIVIGQTITSGATAGTTITALGTATAQTGTGALGTYTISTSQTVSAITQFTSGNGAVVQPNAPGTQAAGLLSNATNNGVIVKYQIAPSVNSDAANTTTNQTTSITSQVQVGMTFATNSVYAVNKATHQAGIGVAGVLSATTQTLAINYMNVSSGAITPTQEANDIIEIKAGPLTTTAALTPVAVLGNTTAEQIFTITGNICLPGTIALVNKPTAQAGLGYSPFARVVGVNQVGVTFASASTSVTPTAAETYTFAFLPQLNAFNPTFIYGISAGQGACTASSTTEKTSGVVGIMANDVISGISKPAIQATTTVVGGRVTSGLPTATTGVVGIAYANLFAAETPTSSEVYLATVQRQVPLNPMMIYSAALATSAVAATTSVEVTTTVTGLVVSSSVLINKPTCTPGLLVTNARVSAANTLAVQYMNLTTTSINVPSETYTIGNVQIQGPGLGVVTTAGLFVAQSFFPSAQQSMVLANALRTAMVNMNMIAGT